MANALKVPHSKRDPGAGTHLHCCPHMGGSLRRRRASSLAEDVVAWTLGMANQPHDKA